MHVRVLNRNLWIATTAIIPRRALLIDHRSRNQRTSNMTNNIMIATAWPIAARTEPNFLQHIIKHGPIQQAMPNNPRSIPALTAIGANAMMAIRMRELVGVELGKGPSDAGV